MFLKYILTIEEGLVDDEYDEWLKKPKELEGENNRLHTLRSAISKLEQRIYHTEFPYTPIDIEVEIDMTEDYVEQFYEAINC